MTHDEAVEESRRRMAEDAPPNPSCVAVVLSSSTEPGGYTVEWRGTGLVLDDPTDCAACGHPASEHEAGECWVDLDTGEGSQNPRRQCQCDWYRPEEAPRG